MIFIFSKIYNCFIIDQRNRYIKYRINVDDSFQTEEMKKQIKDCEAAAIITVAEIAHIVLEARKNTSASRGPFVVIEDGTRSIPEGSVPFKV